MVIMVIMAIVVIINGCNGLLVIIMNIEHTKICILNTGPIFRCPIDDHFSYLNLNNVI